MQRMSMESSNSKCGKSHSGKSHSGAHARAYGSQAGGVCTVDWELGELNSAGPKE